ncbi:ABC transporter permease [Roseburia hominis]
MEIKTLWLADSRRHKGSLAGIFVLIFLVSVSLVSVMTIWKNSGQYVKDEMERLGFGTITAWVSGISDIEMLTEEIDEVSGVEKTGIQPIIFSEYEVNGQESDSEGQLITYEPERYAYKIFSNDLKGYGAEAVIHPGEICVSPSLHSMFGVEIGDEISFLVSRNGGKVTFTVKDWFEDPFIGSSMIGMKSFLICSEDYERITGMIRKSGIDALARDGYMVHIFQSGSESAAQLNAVLNRDTALLQYAEFTHSDSAIFGFMMTLQNVFTGLLLAFVLILIVVAMIVMGHSISSSLEQDMEDIGILKTIGFTTKKLQKIQMQLYLIPVFLGIMSGVLGAIPVSLAVSRMTMTTTGLLVPAGIPFAVCFPTLLLVFGVLAGFVWLRTAQLEKITPMKAIRGADGSSGMGKSGRSPIHQRHLSFWLALRQVVSGKRRYLGACFVAILLVFFASLIGRMDSWLGSDGKGLMDAFNPADLHIAAQPMGEATSEEVERTIEEYTNITDRYMLAMPSVSVEGTDYTANVITQPERFHMLQGQSCMEADEIVLTEFVAADLNVGVGDMVSVSAGRGNAKYRVSGIYQCANDMGANVGLSREGYQRIGQETANMWCIHYFIEDIDVQPQVMEALDAAYGGDVYLHENSWPGLYGILSAMELLMYFMYGTVIILIFVITALTGSKLLVMEQKDMGVYRSFGFTAMQLRISFAIRFGIVSLLGALIGMACSAFFTDPLVAALLRSFGISNFSSHPSIGNVLFPALVVITAFTVFAWGVAGKIKTGRLAFLLSK